MKPTLYKSSFEGVDKSQILVTISELRDQIDRVKGAVNSAFGLLKIVPQELPLYKSFNKQYTLSTKEDLSKGLEDDVQAIDQRLALLSTMVKERFDDNVIAAGLTYDKVGILQFIESMAFGVNFIKRFTDDMVAIEIASVDKVSNPASVISRGEYKWVEDSTARYMLLVDYLRLPVRSIEKTLESIPEALISWDDEAVKSLLGRRADPFACNFKWSPILFARRVIENLRIDAYRETENEIQALEFRIQVLKNRVAQTPDPRIEKALEGMASRLNKYRSKMAEMEAKYG